MVISYRMGPPQICLLVYKPWNNTHEYYSYIYYKATYLTTERSLWGPHPVGINHEEVMMQALIIWFLVFGISDIELCESNYLFGRWSSYVSVYLSIYLSIYLATSKYTFTYMHTCIHIIYMNTCIHIRYVDVCMVMSTKKSYDFCSAAGCGGERLACRGNGDLFKRLKGVA